MELFNVHELAILD